jgi:hypothetical protein
MRVGGDDVDLGDHGPQDVFFDDFKSAVEIDGGDDGFIDGGGEGAGHFFARGNAFADDEEFGETGFVGDFGAGSAGDDGRFYFCEIAFEVVGKLLEKGLANDDVEDGVAEEFHAFIAVEAMIGDGGVGEGLFQEIRVFEGVLQHLLSPFAEFGVHMGLVLKQRAARM